MFGPALDPEPVRINRLKWWMWQPAWITMAPDGHLWFHPNGDVWSEDFAAEGPALLHVAIDTAANVCPLVPPNHNNAQMMDPDDAGTLDTGAPASPSTTTASSASQEPRNALSA